MASFIVQSPTPTRSVFILPGAPPTSTSPSPSESNFRTLTSPPPPSSSSTSARPAVRITTSHIPLTRSLSATTTTSSSSSHMTYPHTSPTRMGSPSPGSPSSSRRSNTGLPAATAASPVTRLPLLSRLTTTHAGALLPSRLRSASFSPPSAPPSTTCKSSALLASSSAPLSSTSSSLSRSGSSGGQQQRARSSSPAAVECSHQHLPQPPSHHHHPSPTIRRSSSGVSASSSTSSSPSSITAAFTSSWLAAPVPPRLAGSRWLVDAAPSQATSSNARLHPVSRPSWTGGSGGEEGGGGEGGGGGGIASRRDPTRRCSLDLKTYPMAAALDVESWIRGTTLTGVGRSTEETSSLPSPVWVDGEGSSGWPRR